MEIKTHVHQGIKIAEVLTEEVVVMDVDSGLQLLVDLYYQGYDGIFVQEKNIIQNFFDLKTGLAGDLLQKFSNYKVRLTIIGDFEKYESKSLRDFIFESNKGKLVNFRSSVQHALEAF